MLRSNQLAITICVLGIATAATAQVGNGELGLSFEPSQLRCSGPAIVNQPLRLYVVMRLEGPPAEGTGGVEFRIDGLPSEWAASAVPSLPGALWVGDALGDGIVIGFQCEFGGGDLVTVCELLAIPTTDVRDHVLRIVRRVFVPNPEFQCPAVAICMEPFTMYCVEGGTAVLNPEELDCLDRTPVQPSSWSSVKELFRR